MDLPINNLRVVKTGPSLGERWERLMAARHHTAVITRLVRFRQELETDAAPEPWTYLDAPLVLVLADVCDALGLNAQEKAQVLGQRGQNAVAEVLETHVTVRPECLLNERQAKALKYVQRHGRINQSAYRQLYPHFSSETLRLDLADLVARGLLRKHGDCRGTYYTAAA